MTSEKSLYLIIKAIRLGSLVVKTFVYQPMDRGSNPEEGKKFFFFPQETLKSLNAYMRRWRAKG